MYYMRNGLNSKTLPIIFSIFAMIACIGTGNATQSNAMSGVLHTTMNIPPWVSGAVIMVIVAFVIIGGVKRIASINEKLVPLMAVFFIVSALIVLGINFKRIPFAFSLIFTEAFDFDAVFGGAAGYSILTAMRFGVGRGVFTNEAGLGSAPIAHAASSTKNPVKQGMWGMFEVFITTIVICTVSALVILTSDVYSTIFSEQGVNPSLNGAALSSAAFNEALPVVGEFGVAIATVFFSLSTILGWAYYGEVCAGFLFRKKGEVAITTYRIVYITFVFVGAVASIDVVWLLADCFNVLMALPNLIAIVALSKVVSKLTKEHFANKKSIANAEQTVQTKS